MTKAEQILELHATGWPNNAIAEKVGCHPSYVRVVVGQRKGAAKSANDIRYENSSLGRLTRRKYIDEKRERYQNDPEYRAFVLKQESCYYERRKASTSGAGA